ncbi:MAG: hypothetical protein BKP49_02635 [Treponema sp. CETP13]|nr:MAG: hypothetical protein BKP49_02635 [Treponema sp. CETP13]
MKTLETVNSIVEKYALKETISAFKGILNLENNTVFQESAVKLASIFGNSENSRAIASNAGNEDEKKLITSFHNNTQLLVQKTWIEKADETLKEKILLQLEEICDSLLHKKYYNSYAEFVDCLDSIVYLMFGAQSKSYDFGEYAMRIDPEFGVFWCFLQNIKQQELNKDEFCRVYQLVSMTFLANY